MVYLNGWLLACKSGDMTGKVIEPGTFAIADYALAGCKGFADITILPDSVISDRGGRLFRMQDSTDWSSGAASGGSATRRLPTAPR